MTPGHDLCGRFRLRRLLQTRSDRVVWAANDLVTKRMVRVHLGQANLLGEVATLQRIQGRGILPFVGLWRDGTDVALVFAYRLPQTCLLDCDITDAMRCVRWLADLAAALSRLQVAGIGLGNVDASRIWVSGDTAWLDPTGPVDDGGSVRSDLIAVGEAIAAVADLSGARRGPRELLQMLRHPDADCRPATALTLRRLTERAVTAPKRAIGPARQVTFAPRRAHQLLVQGPDGEWIQMGGAVSLRRRLTRWRRLRSASVNWRWQRVALGWIDVVVTALLGLIAGVVVPCVGGPIGVVLAWRWRRARCRPGAGDAGVQVEWVGEDGLASLVPSVSTNDRGTDA